MVFNKAYNREEFVQFLRNNFLPEDFEHAEEAVTFSTQMKYTSEATKLGTSDTLDLVVYEVKHTSQKDARVALSKEAFRLLADDMQDRALVVFVPKDNADNYRFSFIEISLDMSDDKSSVSRNYSNPRRYSYLLGKDIACYTPNKYLNEKGRVVDDEDLHSRFSVEVLTKEFYSELSDWYAWAIQIIRFPNDINDDTDDAKYNSESAIRMITRLIFVWFLKQRNLIPNEFFDESNVGNLLKGFDPHADATLFTKSKESRYYKAILQNLFFAMLNSPITAEGESELSERHFRDARGDYDNNKLMRYEDYFSNPQGFVDLANKVPFLNGGLFDCLDDKDNGMYYDGFSDREAVRNALVVPDYLFFGDEVGNNIDLSEWYGDKKKKKVSARGIIDILRRYNFTVEENTPFDKEVSLDPELLGKVFENLLASFNPETQTTARKQTGSFYTPREIVQYMVDESLIAHLKRTAGEELEPKLRQLLQYTDDDVELTEEQRMAIMQSLYHCKILDPACGSGAFPMGILQQMVHILGRIDPDNVQWKKMMMQQAVDDTTEAFKSTSKEERKDLIADIERSFDDEINRPDYARKLYLIENCIYGVDIQPIAIQISKLRFFISLVVDQNTNTDPVDNFGIRPLPNLEAKFVAANTLIGLQKNDATLFDTVAIKAKEEELKDAKHKIFSAKTVRTKRKYRKMVNDLRQEIADMLLKGGVIGNDEARQLASWDMFDQNASSPFFDPEWMFGVKDGFDIVIGNPPYGAKLTNEEKSLYGTTYRNKTSETAILFIEKAINLIGYDGVQLYIIPKAFTYSSNYESIREYVRKNLAQIVDCGKAFENVKLEACIEIVNKKNISDNYKNVLYVNKSFISLGLIDKSTKDIFGFYLNGVSPSSIAVAMKMRINSTLLGKISTNVRGDALQQSLNFEIGKPVVGGINIDRYGIKDFKGYITKGVTYNNKAVIKDNSLLFQNIIAHIANPYPHIKLIGCVPSNLDYLIIDTINQISLNECVNNKYIWALLNSKLLCWYVYLFIYAKAIRTMHFDSVSTDRIPIKVAYEKEILLLVDKILSTKSINSSTDTTDDEQEIDYWVYKIYGLTYDEVKIVDPETPITEKEYKEA
jgi:adenine-specific DNA-methyltransferase